MQEPPRLVLQHSIALLTGNFELQVNKNLPIPTALKVKQGHSPHLWISPDFSL